jgi:hypothetical protein
VVLGPGVKLAAVDKINKAVSSSELRMKFMSQMADVCEVL